LPTMTLHLSTRPAHTTALLKTPDQPSSASFFLSSSAAHAVPHSFPTRRSSDLQGGAAVENRQHLVALRRRQIEHDARGAGIERRSEEHTSELQSLRHLVCRLLLEKKKGPIALL